MAISAILHSRTKRREDKECFNAEKCQAAPRLIQTRANARSRLFERLCCLKSVKRRNGDLPDSFFSILLKAITIGDDHARSMYTTTYLLFHYIPCKDLCVLLSQHLYWRGVVIHVPWMIHSPGTTQ